MKTKSIITIVSTLAIALGTHSHAQKPGTTKAAKKKAESVVLVKSADIHNTFEEAKKAFVGGDTKGSSAAIKAAANQVSQQQASASAEHAVPLGKAATDLLALSKSVQAGKVKDVKVLDQTFAATHQTLAEFYQGKAQRSLDAGDKTATAQAMQAAANHVENGAKWAGTKLGDTAKGTVGLLRTVSGGILSGAGTGVETIGNVLGKGTKTITNIGSKIRGEGAEADANVAKKAAKGAQGAAGSVVETTGKATEKVTGGVSDAGKGIQKIGAAVKGDKKPDAATEEPKKDQ